MEDCVNVIVVGDHGKCEINFFAVKLDHKTLLG